MSGTCVAAVVLLTTVAGNLDVRLVAVALAVPALVVLPSVLARPRLVLAGLVVVVTANLGTVAAGLGVPALTKAVLLLAGFAAWRGVRRGELVLRRSVVHLTLLGYLLAQTASLLFADDRAAGLSVLSGLVQAAVLLLVLSTLASGPGGRSVLAMSVVATLGGLAALSVVQEFALGNSTELLGLSRVSKTADIGSSTRRHAGPYFDANFWGRDLVLFVPLALALATAAGRRSQRLLAAGAAAAMVLGTYLTQSRGAFLALGVGVIVHLALGTPRQRRLLWAAPVMALVLAALPGVGSRLESVTQVAQAATGGGDQSLVGRVAVLRLGLAMAADRPLLGVGTGNFTLAQPEYQRRDPTFTRRTLAPHNLYVQLAAESGLLGLLSWLAFFGSIVVLALSARHRRQGLPRGPSALPGALVAGLAAWAFASVFLHLAEFHLLVIAVALVLLLHDRTREVPVPERPESPPLRFARRLAAATALVCFCIAVAGAASALPMTRHPWEVTVFSTVTARDGGGNPYEYDVAGRGVINTSFAVLLEEQTRRVAGLFPAGQRPQFEVANQPTSQLLTVTAVSPERAPALEAADQVLVRAVRQIDATGSFYVLRPLQQPRVSRRTVLRAGGAATALGLGAGVAAVSAGAVLAAGGALDGAGRHRRRAALSA